MNETLPQLVRRYLDASAVRTPGANPWPANRDEIESLRTAVQYAIETTEGIAVLTEALSLDPNFDLPFEDRLHLVTKIHAKGFVETWFLHDYHGYLRMMLDPQDGRRVHAEQWARENVGER